jgi:hypothetical protein
MTRNLRTYIRSAAARTPAALLRIIIIIIIMMMIDTHTAAERNCAHTQWPAMAAPMWCSPPASLC